MVDFKWILSPVFLTMMLQFEAAETTRQLLRAGREAVLSCENVKQGQQRCDGTTWLFSGGRTGPTVQLFNLGQIGENARHKSDRLSLTESCSLVIKKVTAEDAGVYGCLQYNSAGHKVAEDAVDVSVVTVTEQRKAGVATVKCSVSMYEPCGYTVKWLLDGRVVDGNIKDVTTSESSCSASVEILKPCDNGGSRFQSLSCEVRNDYGEVDNFNPPPLCKTPGETGTTRAATSSETPVSASTTSTMTPKTKTNTMKIREKSSATTESTITSTPSGLGGESKSGMKWKWQYIVVTVLLVALLICFVGVVRWRRVRGKKRRTNTPPSAPEAEDVVSYASISFSRNNAERDLHHGEMVTYSTVRASPSSAHADPSNLYAVINAPKKKR